MIKTYEQLYKYRKILNPALFLISIFYHFFIKLLFFLYKIKILKQYKLNCKIICVGNLTLGGTGKTPIVIELSKEFQKRNKKIVILSKAYKTKPQKTVEIISNKTPASSKKIGDEPSIISNELQLPIIICKDRTKGAYVAIKKFNPDVIIMDDGFQHQKLYKNFNILCVDALNFIWKENFFPLGNLREGIEGMHRSDVILLTKVNLLNSYELELWNSFFKEKWNKLPVIKFSILPEYFINLAHLRTFAVAHFLSPAPIFLLSSIGNPVSFEKLMVKLGFKVIKHFRFIDHYFYTKKDLIKIFTQTSAHTIVTTMKDSVKLLDIDGLENFYKNIYCLKVRYEVVEEDKKAWEEILKSI